MGKTAFIEDIPHEYLLKYLRYSRETGLFHRRIGVGRLSKGTVAGTTRSDGYVVIKVQGKNYLAHRLAWFYVFGVWPSSGLDHRDLNPGNNRFRNLRLATDGENQQNLRSSRAHNACGLLGVHLEKRSGKFAAQIRVGKTHQLIRGFATAEEAHLEYRKLKKEFHPFQTLTE